MDAGTPYLMDVWGYRLMGLQVKALKLLHWYHWLDLALI